MLSVLPMEPELSANAFQDTQEILLFAVMLIHAVKILVELMLIVKTGVVKLFVDADQTMRATHL